MAAPGSLDDDGHPLRPDPRLTPDPGACAGDPSPAVALYLASVAGVTCGGCTSPKSPTQPFCPACLSALSRGWWGRFHALPAQGEEQAEYWSSACADLRRE